MNCVDCGSVFDRGGGRGRPRIRCVSCSPTNRRPGQFVGENITAEIRVCPICSSAFISSHGAQTICSIECRKRDHYLRQREDLEASRDRSPRPCKWCGAVFSPAYGDFRQDYCGVPCRKAVHAKRTAGKAHERRARKFGAEIERVNKLKVFERDGWRCRICNIETPRALMGTKDGRAPELDHAIPLSRGGGHTYANTQLACHDCNALKSDMTVDELLQRLAA